MEQSVVHWNEAMQRNARTVTEKVRTIERDSEELEFSQVSYNQKVMHAGPMTSNFKLYTLVIHIDTEPGL